MPRNPKIICKQCEQVFRQSRSWQVFCKEGCRREWHHNRRLEALKFYNLRAPYDQ